MPQLVTIEGCGAMVCSTYDEMAAVIDRAYAVEEDQPLTIGRAFGSLAAQAAQEVNERVRTPSLPDRVPFE